MSGCLDISTIFISCVVDLEVEGVGGFWLVSILLESRAFPCNEFRFRESNLTSCISFVTVVSLLYKSSGISSSHESSGGTLLMSGPKKNYKNINELLSYQH